MPGDRPSSSGTAASSVEFRHATKRYGGQADAALEDFSLTVGAGEVCVLVVDLLMVADPDDPSSAAPLLAARLSL